MTIEMKPLVVLTFFKIHAYSVEAFASAFSGASTSGNWTSSKNVHGLGLDGFARLGHEFLGCH